MRCHRDGKVRIGGNWAHFYQLEPDYIFCFFSGQHPWFSQHATNQFALMYKIASSNELPSVPADISDSAKAFIACCLKRDPSERLKVHELAQHDYVADLV
jgi:serine/threonine protein kinase